MVQLLQNNADTWREGLVDGTRECRKLETEVDMLGDERPGTWNVSRSEQLFKKGINKEERNECITLHNWIDAAVTRRLPAYRRRRYADGHQDGRGQGCDHS